MNLSFQVIPWLLSDSNFVRCPSQRLDPSKTVFVGALHGVFGAKCESGVQYTIFRCLDCWGPGSSVCRPVWRRHLCWDRHGQIQVIKQWCHEELRICSLKRQVPNREWPCNLQQCQVLHESSGRSFHRDQDCQVHEEGAGRPLPGRRPLLLLLRPSRTLFLQVKTDFSKLILLNT